MHGRLHANCIVVVRSGQGAYWNDERLYFGAANVEDMRHLNEKGWPDRLHWPGTSDVDRQALEFSFFSTAPGNGQMDH